MQIAAIKTCSPMSIFIFSPALQIWIKNDLNVYIIPMSVFPQFSSIHQ